MKGSGKYAIRFPEIRNLECTAYLENEVKWVENWERQVQSQRVPYGAELKRISIPADEELATAQAQLSRVDGMLAAVRGIVYRQLDIEGCSKYYEQQFDRIETLITRAHEIVVKKLDACRSEYQRQLSQHIEKLQDQSRRRLYNKRVIHQKSQEISLLEERIKQLQKIQRTAEFLMEKYYQTNLEIGYNIKDEGLVWVLKRIGLPKSYDHLPRFLNTAEKNFLVERYTNWARKESLLKQRATLTEKSHELCQKQTISPLMNFGRISDRAIKSQRLEISVNDSLSQITMNKQRMRELLLDSAQVKATANEIVYGQTSRKIASYFTNRELSRLNTRRSSFNKRQLERRKELELEIQHVDCRIKTIDQRMEQLSQQVLEDIRKEFTSPGGLNSGRLPTTVVGALFGLETASREAGRLSDGLLQLHSPH